MLERLAISDESDDAYVRHIEDRGLETVAVGDLAAGDVTFHSGWLLHSAPANRTDHLREAVVIIFYADGIAVTDPEETGHGAWPDPQVPCARRACPKLARPIALSQHRSVSRCR